ncbi:MAG: DNA polymerase III subunit delta' [Pseudomonadota bacterium]
MQGFQTIAGQEKTISTLSAFLTSGNIPHAIIFSGISGSGKQETATVFAMALNCRNRPAAAAAPCEACRTCRNIRGDRHPDVLHLRPPGKMIKVDQIRQLRDTIAMKPFEAETRLVIIHDAHTMNVSAANALLKSLEEPPPKTVFLLLTDQPGRFLPTVISRCQLLRFTPIAVEAIQARLTADGGLAPADAALIARLAGGSMSAAEKMSEPAWRRHRQFILEIMGGIDTLSPGVLLALAGRLSDAALPAAEALDIMETWIRDMLTVALAPDLLINVDLADKIQYSATRTTVETSLHRARAVQLARRRLGGNANVKLTMEHLLLDMAHGQAPTG